MEDRPFFSVVVPAYNRAASIHPTLLSVQNQTFSDFECLVIDDGSRDGEALSAVVLALNDKRFRYIRRENGGASAARNTGIDSAAGIYIAFLDSDDFYLPEKLASDRAAILKAGAPETVVFSQVLADRGVGKYRVIPARAPFADESMGEYLLRRQGFTQTSTLVVERELARSVRFAEGLPMAQDCDFPIRLEAAGATLQMKEKPAVVWMDINDPNRVSSMPPFEPMLKWIEEIRPLVGTQAYFAFRGSQIARLAAPRNRRLAICLLTQAVVRFSMPPSLAAKSVIQVFLPRKAYRGILDKFVSIWGVRKKDPS